MNLKIISGPTTEPVTLAEATLHLKVDSIADNSLITMLIKAARQSAENFTARALASQVLELILDDFSQEKIVLPRPPVENVLWVKYRNSSGIEATVPSSDYIAFVDADPAEVVPAYCKSWPSFIPYPRGAVRIRYTAGYKPGSPNPELLLPEAIKEAILLSVGSWYENRQDLLARGHIPKSLPLGAEYLLYQYRIWSFK